MSFSAIITEGVVIGGQNVSRSNTHTSSASVAVEETVAATTTDYNIIVALDQSEIKALYITADKALTLETNDATTPDDTITLVANQPYVWSTTSYFANLVTADVTSLYVTNASGSAATLILHAIQDATP